MLHTPFDKLKANNKEQSKMKIAIPLFDGKLSQHFGHCEKFAVIDTDDNSNSISNREDMTPPPHEPGGAAIGARALRAPAQGAAPARCSGSRDADRQPVR